MLHIDLFSGIGGFSYALDQVYGKENIKHIFIENDPFCQAVLKKHWSEAEIHGDIRAYSYAKCLGRNERPAKGGREGSRQRHQRYAAPFILTGGFPCQPFSQAGVRKGTSDDRYLWPEMLRVISEARPRWVIAENVAGLLSIENGMVFEQVCSDLEGEGYEVWPFVIPACAVGAPHRRDRVWIVANSNSGGLERKRAKQQANGYRQGGESRTWERDWREVAFATCHDRVDDGLSYRMDGVTISAARHRRERLKACGNAIVPQVAMEIIKGIKEHE